MSYTRHHAIIVSCYSEETVNKAHEVAKVTFAKIELFIGGRVSEIMTSPVNTWYTFFVGPDGSDEGWSQSIEGDAQRRSFIDYLDAQRFEDGSPMLIWAVVQYGDEDGDNRVTETESRSRRSRRRVPAPVEI